MGAEVGLGKGDGEGGIGREVESRVAFPPVSRVWSGSQREVEYVWGIILDYGNVDRGRGAGTIDFLVRHCVKNRDRAEL